MSAHTLMLDDSWDITLTGDGKIKTATDAYAVAQNASNAVRLFTNDAYFDKRKGVPHFDIELGNKFASIPMLETKIRNVTIAVEGVSDAMAVLEVKNNRVIGGNVYITLTSGENANLTI